MKKHTRVAAVAWSGLLLFATALPAQAANYDAGKSWTGQSPSYTETTLAMGGDGIFPNYRIPALTVTNDGTLLASYDGRPTGIDAPGPNSILQRRSHDLGLTWDEQTAIHPGKTTAPVEGFSDPSYIVDRQTGTIFNFHVRSFDAGLMASRPGVSIDDRNVLHAEVSVSNDDGLTWEHRTITADITPDLTTKSRFAASGQGIQLQYGPYAGRLIQQYTIVTASGDFQAVSIYSDDHGLTWQSGTPVGTRMDENKTVELSDGTVMLNSRDSAKSGFRKVAYSTDGGVTYGEVTLDRELPDPANNASIIRAYPNAPEGSPEAKVLLFSNAASSTARENGTVRMSCDDGQSWPIAKVFQEGPMAYSTLATLPDGQIGLLYEPGHNGLVFAKFNMAWLGGSCSSIATNDVTIERGSSLTTDLSITNQLGPNVNVTSLEADAPEGWEVSIAPLPKKGLQPGKTATTKVTITVPESAAGGTYRIPITMTDKKGRTSQTVMTVTVPKIESEIDGRISVTVQQVNPKTSYQVGDVLSFKYRVTNLTSAVTTVVPTGNLDGLDPANAAKNCRWRNLPGNDAYNCGTPYHVVTAEDISAGFFEPKTVWTSTSGSDVTSVEVNGPRVALA